MPGPIDSYELDPQTGVATFHNPDGPVVSLPGDHPAAQQKMQSLGFGNRLGASLAGGLQDAGAMLMNAGGAQTRTPQGPLERMHAQKKKEAADKAAAEKPPVDSQTGIPYYRGPGAAPPPPPGAATGAPPGPVKEIPLPGSPSFEQPISPFMQQAPPAPPGVDPRNPQRTVNIDFSKPPPVIDPATGLPIQQ